MDEVGIQELRNKTEAKLTMSMLCHNTCILGLIDRLKGMRDKWNKLTDIYIVPSITHNNNLCYIPN